MRRKNLQREKKRRYSQNKKDKSLSQHQRIVQLVYSNISLYPRLFLLKINPLADAKFGTKIRLYTKQTTSSSGDVKSFFRDIYTPLDSRERRPTYPMGNIVTISAAAQFYLLLMCCCFATAYFILCRRVVWICLLFLASPLSAPPEFFFFSSSSSFSYIELPSIICLSPSGHLIETTDVAGNQSHLLTKQLVQEGELCSVSVLRCSI